jgi:exonuclease SbcC
MKVSEINISNFKNIEIASIELNNHINVISGKNGAGKSSVIEAMMDAIIGKTNMGKVPQRKIKKGSDSATIEVVLATDSGELVVQRKITAKGVYLKARRSDGTKVTQTDLSNLLNNATINITRLLTMKPSEQIDFIKEVAGIDTEQVEDEYRRLYAERRMLKQILNETRAVFEAMGEVEEVAHIDVSEVQKELSEAMQHNQAIDREINEISIKEAKITSLESAIDDGVAQIEELQERIDKIKEKNKERKTQIGALKKEIKAAKPRKRIDVAGLNAKMAEASEINKRADRYQEFLDAEKKVLDAEVAVSNVAVKMEEKLSERQAIIEKGKLPFKNIGLDKELGLTISGIPFAEMSTAQKIRVMSRIYIESNPELKVIYIQDGSLLDDHTLSQITEMSDMKDFQFLIEVVGEQEGAIVMREGHVVTDEEDE